ncbi:hypothetical protein RvY_04803 [Ramazzottius varieornatus]|uniref:Uncharacterized protein n=1 Tax=Ramazzottius varieornatus TaxID=947166 RepID=A0A1D1UW37_RAMVA|nr:hypothetical protein RvY_04803 [Ramazzottius varieornatus]
MFFQPFLAAILSRTDGAHHRITKRLGHLFRAIFHLVLPVRMVESFLVAFEVRFSLELPSAFITAKGVHVRVDYHVLLQVGFFSTDFLADCTDVSSHLEMLILHVTTHDQPAIVDLVADTTRKLPIHPMRFTVDVHR